MAHGGMRHVELDEESADAEAVPRAARGRVRWWMVVVGFAAALAVVGYQLVVDARERTEVAQLADVPGVLAPVDDRLPVTWRSSPLGDLFWYKFATRGLLVGPVVDDDGAQRLVAYDLATGALRWSTELYGPDPDRAEAESDRGASPPVCLPTTDGPDPAQVACLASDGFVRYGYESSARVQAAASFVRVIDTEDGRIVAQWPAAGASLAVVDDVAVLASYADSYGAVTLDGRDLLTGAPRWVVHRPAPTQTGSDAVTDWPPDVYRVAHLLAYADFTGRPALFDVDGRRVHQEIDEASTSGSPGGQVLAEPRSGRLVLSEWSDGSGYGRTTVLDGDRPGYTFRGSPYVPAVDDGSAPGLMLFFAADARRDDDHPGVALSGADVESGDVRWTSDVKVSTDVPGAMILRRRAFVLSRDGLVAVDTRSGRTVWSVEAPAGTMFSPPMTDGRQVLVSIQEPDDIRPGDLVALDPETGTQVWRKPLPGGVDHLYAAGDVLLGLIEDHDGHVQEVVRIG
jgi:hypothetical protein